MPRYQYVGHAIAKRLSAAKQEKDRAAQEVIAVGNDLIADLVELAEDINTDLREARISDGFVGVGVVARPWTLVRGKGKDRDYLLGILEVMRGGDTHAIKIAVPRGGAEYEASVNGTPVGTIPVLNVVAEEVTKFLLDRGV
jgi:hypothetical protein